MKLIMESWNTFANNVEVSNHNVLLVEECVAGKITEDELFNTFNAQLNEEIQNILTYGETLQEGRIGDFVKEKIWPMAQNTMDKIIAAAQQAPAVAMRLAKAFIDGVQRFAKFIGPKGVAILTLIGLTLAIGIFQTASAAIPGMEPDVLNAYVGYLDLMLDMAMRDFNIERAGDFKEMVKAVRTAHLSGDEHKMMDVIRGASESASQVGQVVLNSTQQLIRDAAGGDTDAAEQFTQLAQKGAKILKAGTSYNQ
tara:strand:- start:3403 stop:4161 length:759 start_codon:yes stop_codon:yes gene_type:complete